MRSLLKRLLLVPLLATSLTTTGCLFDDTLTIFGTSEIFSISVGDVAIGGCFLEEDGTYKCINNNIFSTFETLSAPELLLRFFLLDPLVVQLPLGAGNFAGSYSHTESSSTGPLAISTATSLRIDANRTLTAEPGTQFVVIALPDGAPTTGTFGFNFNFRPPAGATSLVVKPIITGYAKLMDGTEFFPPIMPCAKSMTSVPALTIPIPVPGDAFTLPPLTADLGCQHEVYDFIPSRIGPFMCYGTKPSTPADKLPKGVRATLTDRFETGRIFDVKKPLALCKPATVGGAGGGDTATHLEAFATALAKTTPKQPKHAPRTDLHVTNPFHPQGQLVVDITKASRLLLPSALGPTPPDSATHTVDAFDCYDAKVSKGDAKFPKGLQAAVVDGFAQPRTYVLRKPSRLCVAADRNGTAPGAPAHADQLMCYRVTLAKTTPKQTKLAKVPGLVVSNALTSARRDAVKPDELCVPSSIAP